MIVRLFNTGDILKAIRKKFSVSQSYVCHILQISQSKISKIESGIDLKIEARKWIELCRHFNIEPDSIVNGYIEFKNSKDITLNNSGNVGDFSVPERYKYLAGSTVRTTIPFVNMLCESKGGGYATGYLESKGISSDYFCILENPININFTSDIVEEIGLGLNDLDMYFKKDKIKKVISQKELHGIFWKDYEEENKLQNRISRLVSNVGKYETNFKYTIVEYQKSKVTLSIQKNEHLSEFYISKNVLEFFENYRMNYLKNFCALMKRKKLGNKQLSIMKVGILKG